MGNRRIVVSYSAEASDKEKRDALLDGLRECSNELAEMGFKDICLQALDQLWNDIKMDELI